MNRVESSTSSGRVKSHKAGRATNGSSRDFARGEFFPRSETTCAASRSSPSIRQMAGPAKTRRAICPEISNAVDEISEGTAHPIEHVASFVLRTAERFPDPRFGVTDDAAFVSVLFDILLGLDVFHRRAGKQSFRARHLAAVRRDVNCPDRPRRTVLQCHDPDRVAALVRSQYVT